MSSPGATRYGHTYAEAFMLMTYRCEGHGRRVGSARPACGAEVRIWNSRDGITPFAVGCRAAGCDGHMIHVDWHADEYAPDHTPQRGDLIFADLTWDRALEHRRRYVDEWWDKRLDDPPVSPMCEHPVLGPLGKDGAAEYLAREDVKEWENPETGSGSPDLLEVDDDYSRMPATSDGGGR